MIITLIWIHDSLLYYYYYFRQLFGFVVFNKLVLGDTNATTFSIVVWYLNIYSIKPLIFKHCINMYSIEIQFS